MADPAIWACRLVKRFGPVVALDGIDLQVSRGSVLGLLGPNGAGKTTDVRILTTILQPDAGRASVLGLDVVRNAGQVRAAIGLAGQHAAVDENLTGPENLPGPLRAYANHQPLTATVNAIRPLLLGGPDRLPRDGGHPLVRRHHRRLLPSCGAQVLLSRLSLSVSRPVRHESRRLQLRCAASITPNDLLTKRMSPCEPNRTRRLPASGPRTPSWTGA